MDAHLKASIDGTLTRAEREAPFRLSAGEFEPVECPSRRPIIVEASGEVLAVDPVADAIIGPAAMDGDKP